MAAKKKTAKTLKARKSAPKSGLQRAAAAAKASRGK